MANEVFQAEVLQIVLVIAAGVVGFTISGVAGFGGGMVTLPVLVWAFGPKEAIPVVTIAQLLGTSSRVWLNRDVIDRGVAIWFTGAAIPAALLGSLLFVETDTTILTRALGAAMILMVVFDRLPWVGGIKMSRWGFGPLGAVAGFLASYLGIPGPFIATFYLAYGLTPAAYLGTVSLGLALIQVTKLTVYGSNALLSGKVIGLGLALGAVALGGSLAGRWIVGRIPEKLFASLINLMVLGFGVLFVVRG